MVRHACDNRKCGNPRHLVAGTHQDNMDDKVARGRQSRLKGQLSPTSILRDSQVVDMRRRYAGGEKTDALAQSFGVKAGTVGAIVSGRRWAHLLKEKEVAS